MSEIFGPLSGIITLVGLLVYARSVAIGSTKPSQVTWFVWTLNAFLLLASYHASGAKETIWLSAGYTLGLFIISALTIKYGHSGWGLVDKICLVGAAAGVLLWWVTGSSLTAFSTSLIIDLVGIIPTMYKTWIDPVEEDKTSWVILLIGGVFSLLAIEEWNFIIAWYPLQVTVTTAIIVWFVFRKKKIVTVQ